MLSTTPLMAGAADASDFSPAVSRATLLAELKDGRGKQCYTRVRGRWELIICPRRVRNIGFPCLATIRNASAFGAREHTVWVRSTAYPSDLRTEKGTEYTELGNT